MKHYSACVSRRSVLILSERIFARHGLFLRFRDEALFRLRIPSERVDFIGKNLCSARPVLALS